MEDPTIVRLREMLAKDPKSMAFAPLAEAYRKAGRLDEAITAAEAGLRFHPGYLGGLVALGRALFDKKDYDRSFEILTKVAAATPENYVAQKTLARTHSIRGEIRKALEAFRAVRLLSPGDAEVEEEIKRLEALPPSPEPSKPPTKNASPPPPPPPPPAVMEAMEATSAPEPSEMPEVAKGVGEEAVTLGEEPGSFEGPGGILPGTGPGFNLPEMESIASWEEAYTAGPAAIPTPPKGKEPGMLSAPPSPSLAGERPFEAPAFTEAVFESPISLSEEQPSYVPSLATETLASLYRRQGAEEEARRIQQRLAAARPAAVAGDRGILGELERWLSNAERMRRR